MNEKEFNEILDTYGNAWKTKNEKLILTIFTKNAEYTEKPLKPCRQFKGHAEIKEYWKRKTGKQENLKFKILNKYLCDNVGIAEWKASFTKEKERITIIQVAIMEFEKNKIKKFREYWDSKRKRL